MPVDHDIWSSLTNRPAITGDRSHITGFTPEPFHYLRHVSTADSAKARADSACPLYLRFFHWASSPACSACSLTMAPCDGACYTSWTPSEEIKQHYPSRHSDYRDRCAAWLLVQLGDVGLPLGSTVLPRAFCPHPCVLKWVHYIQPRTSTCQGSLLLARSLPLDLKTVYQLYKPYVKNGRWTFGLFEMWCVWPSLTDRATQPPILPVSRFFPTGQHIPS